MIQLVVQINEYSQVVILLHFANNLSKLLKTFDFLSESGVATELISGGDFYKKWTFCQNDSTGSPKLMINP